jgi:hypothetical protein
VRVVLGSCKCHSGSSLVVMQSVQPTANRSSGMFAQLESLSTSAAIQASAHSLLLGADLLTTHTHTHSPAADMDAMAKARNALSLLERLRSSLAGLSASTSALLQPTANSLAGRSPISRRCDLSGNLLVSMQCWLWYSCTPGSAAAEHLSVCALPP